MWILNKNNFYGLAVTDRSIVLHLVPKVQKFFSFLKFLSEQKQIMIQIRLKKSSGVATLRFSKFLMVFAKKGKNWHFSRISKIFRKSFYIVNINRFLRNFQGTFPELGDRECPLLGLNSHTSSPGQPQDKNDIFSKMSFFYILGNTTPIFTKFSEVGLITRGAKIGNK